MQSATCEIVSEEEDRRQHSRTSNLRVEEVVSGQRDQAFGVQQSDGVEGYQLADVLDDVSPKEVGDQSRKQHSRANIPTIEGLLSEQRDQLVGVLDSSQESILRFIAEQNGKPIELLAGVEVDRLRIENLRLRAEIDYRRRPDSGQTDIRPPSSQAWYPDPPNEDYNDGGLSQSDGVRRAPTVLSEMTISSRSTDFLSPDSHGYAAIAPNSESNQKSLSEHPNFISVSPVHVVAGKDAVVRVPSNQVAFPEHSTSSSDRAVTFRAENSIYSCASIDPYHRGTLAVPGQSMQSIDKLYHNTGTVDSFDHEDEEHEGDETAAAWGKYLFGSGTILKKKTNAIFVDAEAMKDKVREAIGKPQYNVQEFYHERGVCQKVARSVAFENVTLAVIFVNAVWIGVDTDYNDAELLLDARPEFIIAENLFCSYFFAEWSIRFFSFKRKLDCLQDGWFCFDSVLVALMVFETWVVTAAFALVSSGDTGGIKNASILRMARLLRLTRMARMVRLLNAIPELMVLIKGIMIASRSVLLTLALLLAIIYLFGITFKQITHGTDVGSRYFPTVTESMSTLLLKGTLPDQGPWVKSIGDGNFWFGICVLIYVVLTTIMLMNMLLGLLVEVVKCVSSVEKEALLVAYVKEHLKQILFSLDDNSDNHISKTEFQLLMANASATKALRDVGVDAVGLVDRADAIFQDDDEISFAKFLDEVLNLRGTNFAKVKDIVDLRKGIVSEIRHETSKVHHSLKLLERGGGMKSCYGFRSNKSYQSHQSSVTTRRGTTKGANSDSEPLKG